MADEPFTFLITTDNHLGYKKDDSIRCKDSFMAFGEALEIARRRDVDFVLLGGDLFHENRPSTSIEHKCIKIIRKHMNAQDKETTFDRVQGNFSHFHALNHANFEDPNMKVACPIVTIHGNHDDPTGPDAQSICEKLATCGLLNYFGAVRSIKETITIEPIVFQKNQVKIALYGLGFIPDYKLKILFKKNQVKFKQPPPDTFNVLVVHQNRERPFEENKHIPDDIFPKFFHLIIRGHEHNTQSPQIIPESEVNGMVYQPGSTVATSISIMEAAPKKVCLISVKVANPSGDKASRYKMDYELIELKCCRTMLMKDISQKDIFKHIKATHGTGGRVAAAEFKRYSKELVQDVVENLLKDYETNRRSLSRALTESQTSTSNSTTSSQPAKLERFDLPLMRIRLEYTSKNERFDELDIATEYYRKRVANKDIILFKKQKLTKTDDGTVENATFTDLHDTVDDDQDDIFDHVNLGEEKRGTIDYMIEQYFMDRPPEQRLKALSISEYTNAVKGAIEDGNVIAKVLNKKKVEIFKQYRAAICSEEVAELKFNDELLVENWFLRAFGNKSNNEGGDVDMEVLEID